MGAADDSFPHRTLRKGGSLGINHPPFLGGPPGRGAVRNAGSWALSLKTQI